MEIHQLKYVVEVAKYKSFSRAADEICVAQSSLSQQINKLEEELGLKLFERTTRAVNTTDAGAEFLIYARQILSDIETAHQSMQAHIGLTKGTVNIGAISTADSMGFVSMVTAFHKIYPGLYLTIVTHGSYKLTELLRTSEIDVAILTPPVDSETEEIEFYPLADNDEFVLVTSNKHRLAKRKLVSLDELTEENFIFPSPDQSIYNIYLAACRKAGLTPRIVCQSSHCAINISLVSAGMGIGFFPLNWISTSNQRGISVIKLSNPIKKHMALALRKRSYYSPPVVAFCKYLLSAVHGTPAPVQLKYSK